MIATSDPFRDLRNHSTDRAVPLDMAPLLGYNSGVPSFQVNRTGTVHERRGGRFQ
jgi:hypothetical protein